MKKGIILPLVLILASVAIAIGTFFVVENEQPPYDSRTIIPGQVIQKPTDIPAGEITQDSTQGVTGHMLVVKEGDLWQIDANGVERIKLIDLDTITEFASSPISGYIAYTPTDEITETVTDPDGTIHDVKLFKKKLMSSSDKGSGSFLIHKNVDRWGWIPKTDLLWYEPAELNLEFGWSYQGNGKIWIFNTATRKAEEFINNETNSLFTPSLAKWSPDGKKFMFVSAKELKVADRLTAKVTSVFQLPYVGGDRGGPQPIPYFVWSPDSLSIYTIFTPYLFEDETFSDTTLKSEHVNALRLPVNGGKPIKLIPEVPSIVTNEESYPRANFSEDFSKAIYPRTFPNKNGVTLVMYDLTEKKEYVLLENPGEIEHGWFIDSQILSWVVGNYVYVVRGDGNWRNGGTIDFMKINYQTGASQNIASWRNIRGDYNNYVENMYFSPESERLFFTLSGMLISMDKMGMKQIDGNLGDFVEYYFNKHSSN